MKVIKLKNLSKYNYQRIIQKSFGINKKIVPQVKNIMNEVKLNGDKTIFKKYQNRFGFKNYQKIKVTKEEIQKAYQEVSESLISALKQMIKNITSVHQAQLLKKIEKVVRPEKGIAVWRVWRAIEKVGLYIPGGKAIYPSSALMTVIPAQIAGCKEIVMCSPPRGDGQIPAATLVAADLIGLKKIFKVGGTEAIAAMSYGTESVPKVYKIFGAGNSFVTAAKLLAFPEIAIDMPAGPSEIFIIADQTANPKYIAADLLADGEHGPDSACVLLTTSKEIAQKTILEVDYQLKNLSTAKYVRQSLEKYGLIALVDSIEEALRFSNEYAPEHLEIMTKNPEKVTQKITNAGSVFLGDWTTKSSGDYATGANHILPTGGTAKMYPPLGVHSFGNWMQIQKCNKEGLRKIKETIEIVAEVEGLPAHKNSTSIRFNV